MIAPYATRAGADGRARGGVREPAAARAARAATARYGFYEAVDYTPRALPRGQTQRDRALVHGAPPGHELLALAYAAARSADAAALRSRPAFQATDAAAPGARPAAPRRTRTTRTCRRADASALADAATPLRVFTDADTPAPEVQLLSNGRYHVMVTNAGGGYSRWNDLAVTRWREDAHARLLGQLLLPARRRRAARSGRPRTSRRCDARRRATRRSSREGRAEFRRRDDEHRDAHRDHRLARGRHRAAPDARHQPLGTRAHDRGHQLRRGRAGAAGRRRAAPRVQQPVRADRDRRRRGRRSSARAGRARPTSGRRGCCT